MDKELRMEMEKQGKFLETMRSDMEALKGGNTTSGGGQSIDMMCFHCRMPGLRKGGKKFCLWKDLSQAEAKEKVLCHVTGARQGSGTRV
jgi:hypothetical protein